MDKILDWIFGFKVFPGLEIHKKFCYDAKFNEKCCVCKNNKKRFESAIRGEWTAWEDQCINDSRKKDYLGYKTNEECLNYASK